MTRLKMVMALFGALALSQPSFGEPDATGAEVAPATASATPADDDKIVCKKERVMGSMIPVKTCTTRRHEREMREASQDVLNQIQRNTSTSGMGSGEG